MDYITIDFETANSRPTSACSIGIVGVKNSKIEFEEYYLINPEEEFSDYNTNIHQIKESDVANADTFPVLWVKIKDYFANTTVFAHNALFDISVLKAVIEKYHLDPPNIKFGCTLKMATKLWGKDEMGNHRLNTLAKFLEVDHQHHNALSDAKICVEIVERGQKIMGACDCNELYDTLGIRYGLYNHERFFTTINKYHRHPKQKVIENFELNDKIVSFAGKPKSLSKKNLEEKLLINGVYLEKNINRSLDYFIALGNCPKAKINYVKELIAKGVPIKIINEEEFLKLVK